MLDLVPLAGSRGIGGTFRSVAELERAIYQWLANWNEEPRRFVWKATAEVILDKVRRCKELSGTAQ